MDKKILRSRIKEYLDSKGIPTDGTPFRCLNPLHTDNHPSMVFNENAEQVHCFSCDKNFDIFDLIGFEYNISNFAEQVNKTAEVLGCSDASGSDTGSFNPGNRWNDIFFLSGSFFLNGNDSGSSPEYELCQRAYKNRKEAMEYLKHRGIDSSLVEKYGIGYYYGYKILGKICNAVVFPVTRNNYIVRNDDDEAENPHRYFKQGSPFPAWNLDTVADACKFGKPLYVTEGIIDALSLITAGATHVVALNGKEISSFLSAIKILSEEDRKKLIVIPACDSDIPGNEANSSIVLALQTYGVASYRFDLYGSYKDANEALMKDRERFTKLISSLQTKQGLNLLVYEATESDAASVHEYIERNVNPSQKPFIRTGFKKLDEHLNGGLWFGLYIIGAPPSVGKTTLLVQMRDYLCQQHKRVLFFSTETSVDVLRAKTISRRMYERCKKENLNLELAKSASSVMNPDEIKNYTEEERNLFAKTFADLTALSKYAKTFFGTMIDVEEVCETTEDFINRTGIKPVVMIDYLQRLHTRKPIMDDRLRMDEITSQLENLSLKHQIPILCVSSINRLNYSNSINYAAYMGSNSIEFSAECLLGLQYRNMEQSGFNLAVAENQPVRELELVILKCKNGQKNGAIPLDFVAKSCYFEEAKTVTVVEKKEVPVPANTAKVIHNHRAYDANLRKKVEFSVTEDEEVISIG